MPQPGNKTHKLIPYGLEESKLFFFLFVCFYVCFVSFWTKSAKYRSTLFTLTPCGQERCCRLNADSWLAKISCPRDYNHVYKYSKSVKVM